jgi:large subunit ribosomal protein L25
MAANTKLVAEKRTQFGTSRCRRLRNGGTTPGNVYGHGQEPVAIAVSTDRLDALVRSGSRVIECEIEGNSETTMFREVQWDAFGIRIQHFDLIRIDPDERVTIRVSVVTRGTAPGTLAGGHLEQPLRELTLNCVVSQIPDSIVVRIGDLEIGQSISVADLELPENIRYENPPDTVVVYVAEPVAEVEELEEGVDTGPVEPEVIGRKAEEEEP